MSHMNENLFRLQAVYKIIAVEYGHQRQMSLVSCSAVTARLLPSKELCEEKGDIFILCHKRREEKQKSCAVNLHELMQTNMKRNQQHQGKELNRAMKAKTECTKYP